MGSSRGPSMPDPNPPGNNVPRKHPGPPAVSLSGTNHAPLVEMDKNYTDVTDKVKNLKAVYEVLDGHQSTLMSEVGDLQAAAVKLGRNDPEPHPQVALSMQEDEKPSPEKSALPPSQAVPILLGSQAVAAVLNLFLYFTGANPLEGPEQAALLGTIQIVAAAVAGAYNNYPREKA